MKRGCMSRTKKDSTVEKYCEKCSDSVVWFFFKLLDCACLKVQLAVLVSMLILLYL